MAEQVGQIIQRTVEGEEDARWEKIKFQIDIPAEVKKLLKLYFARGQMQDFLRNYLCDCIPWMIDDLKEEFPDLVAELEEIEAGLDKWVPRYRYVGPEPGHAADEKRKAEADARQ